MSTIAYLQLDSNNDPSFADGTSLTNGEAVRQMIYTRLQLFMGEWWENLNIGLPVFQSMLGQLGSQRVQNAIQSAIIQNIQETPYVTSVGDVRVLFENGTFTFTATAQTVFGPVLITNTPGTQAAVSS